MRASPDPNYSPTQPLDSNALILYFFRNLQRMRVACYSLSFAERFVIVHQKVDALCNDCLFENYQFHSGISFDKTWEHKCLIFQNGVSFVVLFQVQEEFPRIKT